MRKTVKNIASLIMVAGALGFASCSDFLDKQPSNELTEEKTLGDWNMFVQFHQDTYNFLRHGAARIGNSWLDSATDLSETSFSTGGTRTSFNIGNYYAGGGWSELTDTWESRYRAIRKCNRVISQINLVPNDITLTPEQEAVRRAQYVAEAHTFRAFFYWEMFLRFGPVPIIEDVLDPTEDIITPYVDRPSVKQFTDFVLSELRNYEADLLNYEDAFKETDRGRLSQPMSRALQSRIMLYLASPRYAEETGVTWQQAADVAKSFINDFGGNFSLYSEENMDGATNYTNAILRSAVRGNSEIIFFRNDGTIGWGSISVDTPVGEGGSGGNCPSQNLVDMYDMADGSAPFTAYDVTGAPVYDASGRPTVNAASGYSEADMWANRDPRFDATVLYQGVEWGGMQNRADLHINVIPGMADNPIGNANATPTGYYMRKYIPASILASNHAGSAFRQWIIFRYAEILMNYAEALNEVQGPCQEVFDCLDMIRHRSGITGNVADRADLASKDAMRNFIHKERTVEFAFEEHRSWDVRRWNCAVEALSRPIYGVDVAADGTVTRKVAQQRVFEQKMYLYPIPETEVWKTGIQNNPGW